MDIYEFIRSKAICEHLKKIGREFTPPECAYLIWKSGFLPAKKRAAWCELIKTMPDCELEGGKSLHEFLRLYMEREDRLINKMRREDDGALYYFNVFGDGDYGNNGTFYRSYENALSAALSSGEGFDGYFYLHKVWIENDADTYKVRITRHIKEELTASGKFAGIYDEFSDEGGDIPDFNELRFEIPVPFKKGDIIYDPYGKAFVWQNEGQPMVFDHIRREEIPADTGEMITDVSAVAYCNCGSDQVVIEEIKEYLDLEYYPEGRVFFPNEKILPVISSYLKGEIELDELLNSHSILLLRSIANSICKYEAPDDEK